MVNGVRRTVALPSVLSVNDADTYRAAASQGLGLIQTPRYSVEQDLADGTLVECLPDTPPSPTSVYVFYPRSRQLSLRVRVFIDWVAKEYASHFRPMPTADITRSSRLLAP
jgi:DNA-binding transcriptional LysR family regulator